ncbi:TPA: hypothetical protein JG871_003936 [Enterobacter hormaechei subsp. xiangfangensis]|nr:hypothetical protein [Enterobacter hormaechei subsp. xiangfangensis]
MKTLSKLAAVSLIALSVSALTGCVAPVQMKVSAPVVKVTPDYTAKVGVVGTDDGFGGKYYQGFSVDVTNNSSQPIKIVWDNTAIAWNGNSSSVLPNGYKIADAAAPKAPTVVPPHSTVTKEITPSSNVSFAAGGWRYAPLEATTYNVYLGLSVNGKDVSEGFEMTLTALAPAVK